MRHRWLETGPGWFRLWGWGLTVTNHEWQRPLFSERMGITRALHVGQWCIKLLRPLA